MDNRILKKMKYILSILIILSSLSAIGQGTPTYQGNTTSISYNRGTVGALRMQLLPRGFYPFPTFDTLGTIWVDSAGRKDLYYHNGTSRIRMASVPYVDSVALSITAGSVDSSIYSTVNRLYKITDSTFNIIDSNNAIIYGAISALYDTLPNYVDTAMLNDSLQAIKAAYVPYTGATTDVNLGTHNILPNSVRLSLTPTGTLTNVGQIYWDVANVTPSVPLNANVTLQMGQEMYIRARNNTGVQINDGEVVYVNDAQGNTPTIALANSDSVSSSIVIGVATENIADNSVGFVTTFGVVNGFNTSGFNDGDALYLNTVSGQLSNTIPPPPHKVVKVGVALNTTVNGSIFVQPANPIGQDTTFTAPYNSDKIAPTQKSVGTFVTNTVNDTAAALRAELNTKGSGTVTSIQLVAGTGVTITPTTAVTTSGTYTISATGGGGGGSPTLTNPYELLYQSGTDTIKSTPKVYVDTTDNRMVLAYDSTNSTVVADPNGGVKIWGSTRMGMSSIRILDTVSIPAALQRSINMQITSVLIPNTTILNGTGNYLVGAPSSIMTGASTTSVVGSYNSTIQHFNYTKLLITSGTGANLTVGIRTNSNLLPLGLICGNTKFSAGGGRGTLMGSFPSYDAGERIFIGYTSELTAVTSAPSTWLQANNGLGVGKDEGDTELYFYHSNNVTTPTKVATGITPNSEDVYVVTVYIAPNSTYYIQLEVRSKTGIQVVTYNPTTNVPPIGAKIYPRHWVNNAATGVAISYGFIQATEEIY